MLFGANLGYLAQSLQEIVNHLRITMDIINDLENCDTHLEKRPLYCHLGLKIVVLGAHRSILGLAAAAASEINKAEKSEIAGGFMMGKKASGKHLTESRKNIVVTEKASFDQPQTKEQVMNRGPTLPIFGTTKKVRLQQQRQNQGLCLLFLTVTWDLHT